jgi:hypothetical protein
MQIRDRVGGRPEIACKPVCTATRPYYRLRGKTAFFGLEVFPPKRRNPINMTQDIIFSAYAAPIVIVAHSAANEVDFHIIISRLRS